jgi:hypothetical protein
MVTGVTMTLGGVFILTQNPSLLQQVDKNTINTLLVGGLSVNVLNNAINQYFSHQDLSKEPITIQTN